MATIQYPESSRVFKQSWTDLALKVPSGSMGLESDVSAEGTPLADKQAKSLGILGCCTGARRKS